MKKLVPIPIISLLVSMIMVIPFTSVAADPTTTLYVDPPSIIDLTMAPPAEFGVNVKVKDVQDLMIFQFQLNYKTTVLTATKITLGDFFPQDSIIFGKEINDTAGYARFLVSMPSAQGLSGSGTLATIHFAVEGYGGSSLFFGGTCVRNKYGYLVCFRNRLQDSSNREMPFEIVDGYFANVPQPKVSVDPESIVDPDHLAPGENFTINVKISDAADLYSYEFFLDYAKDVLTATNIVLGDFFPTDSVVRTEINDNAGYVWCNVTMPTGSTSGKGGNGTLARITFNVKARGESRLDLYSLTNANVSDREFDEYWDGWAKTGSSPWLNASDYPTNYISSNAADKIGNFTFSNVSQGAIWSAIELRIRTWQSVGGDDQIKVSLFDGTSWSEAYTVIPSTVVGDYVDVDVASFLNTEEKLNAAKMRIEKITSGAQDTIYVDYACISLFSKPRLVDSAGSPIEYYEPIDGYFNNKPRFHDVAITQVTTKRHETQDNITYAVTVTKVNVGESVNITVTVMNNGTEPENFTVTAYYNGTTIKAETLTDFQAGTSRILALEWNTAGMAAGNYTIWAEASGLAEDSNPDNNKSTMKDVFMVIGGSSMPLELIAIAVSVLVITLGIVLVYFKVIRKPKPT